MCEFNVLLDNRIVFENATYAKTVNDKVLVRDALGSTVEFEACYITEVDVRTEKLTITRLDTKKAGSD